MTGGVGGRDEPGAAYAETEPRPAAFPGREVLRGEPAEVLRRLRSGDPLDLQARVARRTRMRCLCIDPDRVDERAWPKIAIRAAAYGGTPALGTWLDRCIDDAIDGIVRSELEEERAGFPPCEPPDARDTFLTEAFGVPPELGRAAAAAFNVLPERTRRIFFRLAVDGESPRRCVEEGLGSLGEIRARARSALEALGFFDGDTKGTPRLLRVDRPSGFAPLLDSERGASVGEAFLSRAERHLLAAYREEVAAWLLEACAHLAAGHPTHGRFLSRHRNASEAFDLPGRDELVERWRARAAVPRDEPNVADGLALLELCLGPGRPPELGEVAVASLRLVPSDVARIYGQIHLVQRGEYDAAERALAIVLRDPSPPGQRASALGGRGRILYLRGDYGGAATAYRAATRAAPDQLDCLPYWFSNACLAGARVEALAAAAELDGRLTSNDPVLAQALSVLPAAAEFARTPKPKPDLLRSLAPRVGPNSMRLLDAMA